MAFYFGASALSESELVEDESNGHNIIKKSPVKIKQNIFYHPTHGYFL